MEENEFIKERDLIVGEIGGFSDEDFAKSGISLEEYNNPTAETISKLIEYDNNGDNKLKKIDTIDYSDVVKYSNWMKNSE